jgi:hypothetical protein
MKGALRNLDPAHLIGAVAVALAIALGALLRLSDPLSTPVLPAEDPFTHMVLIKEHLLTGTLDPLNPPGGLYPPGMHALVAALWTFTGVDLYQLVRFSPVLLGALAMIGTAVLLWKHAGRVAAFVGTLAMALAPELIHRTTMMAPTAVDLALLPFLFFALLEVLEGKLAWVGIAAPLAVFLVFAHPWLYGLLALTGVVFAVFALVLPWPTTRSPRLSSPGFAAALAVVGGSLGLVLSTCAGLCGPGFGGILPYGNLFTMIAPLVLVLSFLPAVFLVVQSDNLERWLPERDAGPRPVWLRAGVSLVLALALVGVTWPALAGGLPLLVDPPRMLGWPLLGLAALAFVLLPFMAGRLAYLAGAIATATYPLVMYNPLGSPYWPHRTAVYHGMGLVLLVGVAGGHFARWARVAWEDHVPKPSPVQGVLERPVVAIAPVLLVAGSLGGAVFAGTPSHYADGWYRLYEPCEMEAMHDVSEVAEQDPDAVVVGGDWRPAIVLSAVTENPDRVWYKETFWVGERERKDAMTLAREEGQPLYVVEDRHLRNEHPDADASFLESEDWRVVDSWCSEEISPRHRVVLHELTGVQG